MLIEGIDDDPLPNAINQNSHYALDDTTVYRAPSATGSHQRQDSTQVRSSVILPRPSGKEKKKGYFSKVVKSIKSLNKYIYKTKASQGLPPDAPAESLQTPAKGRPTDIASFHDQLNQIKLGQKLAHDEDVGVFAIGSDEDESQEEESKEPPADSDTDDDLSAQITVDKPKPEPKKTEEPGEFEYVPYDRELAAACYHRLPAVGRRMVLDQFPAFFKIEQLIVPPAKSRRRPTGFFAKWWKASDSTEAAA